MSDLSREANLDGLTPTEPPSVGITVIIVVVIVSLVVITCCVILVVVILVSRRRKRKKNRGYHNIGQSVVPAPVTIVNPADNKPPEAGTSKPEGKTKPPSPAQVDSQYDAIPPITGAVDPGKTEPPSPTRVDGQCDAIPLASGALSASDNEEAVVNEVTKVQVGPARSHRHRRKHRRHTRSKKPRRKKGEGASARGARRPRRRQRITSARARRVGTARARKREGGVNGRIPPMPKIKSDDVSITVHI